MQINTTTPPPSSTLTTASHMPVGKPPSRDPHQLDNSSFKPAEKSSASSREQLRQDSTQSTPGEQVGKQDATETKKPSTTEQQDQRHAELAQQLAEERVHREKLKKERAKEQEAEEIHDEEMHKQAQNEQLSAHAKQEAAALQQEKERQARQQAASRYTEINQRTMAFNESLGQLEIHNGPPPPQIDQQA